MRIIVTGGAGFIGSCFTRQTLDNTYPGLHDAHVTVIDNLSYSGNIGNIPAGHPRLTFVHGDITDRALLAEVLPGHDAVLHFAAESHVDRSIRDGASFVHANVVGTQRLLDAARDARIPRFVHVSTDEVYGSIDEGHWTEESPLAPRSPYAASKAGSDMMALAAHRTHGMDVVVTRCSNNYGPYQFPEKVIPLFVTSLLGGRSVPLYGDGGNVRDWLHVDDHCRGIALVLAGGRPGQVYHIGGGTHLTNRELTGMLLEACGAGWDMVRTVPDRKGHDRRYALNIDKITEELGYVPRIPFADGLAATVEWYRENRDWWLPLESRVLQTA